MTEMTATMSETMPDVWCGVPEVAALTVAINNVQTAHANISAAAYNPSRAGAGVADIVAGGGDIPADLGRTLWDAVHAAEQAGLQREVLWSAREQLRERLAEVKRDRADDALTLLDSELRATVAEARKIEPRLRNITSAEDAIRGDVAAEWARLDACAKRHGEVRVAQHHILVGAGIDRAAVGPLIERAGRMRNVLDLDPLATRIATGQAVPEPWPTYAGTSPDYVRWLAGPAVEAWVPGVVELQAAADRQDRAIAEADHARAVAASTAGPVAELRQRVVHKRQAGQLAAQRQ